MAGKDDDLIGFDLYGGMGDTQEKGETNAQQNLGAGGDAQNLVGDVLGVDQHDEVDNRIYKLVPQLQRSLIPHMHGGRKPKLLRYEVDMIRADGRSTRKIAEHYGVSENTVRRVKQQGVYRDVPYIPADEYIRDVTSDGNNVQTPMSDHVKKARGEPVTNKKIGRPFPSGRQTMTDAELIDIASSSRPLRESAQKYNVSIGTISNIKRRMRDVFPDGVRDVVQAALNDPRTPKQLAEHYGMPESWFAEVREKGYAMTSDGPVTSLKEGDRLVLGQGRRR